MLLAGIAVLAIGLWPSAGRAERGSTRCASRAESLRAAASACREDVQSRRLSSCTVTLEYRNGASLSPSEADHLADVFTRRRERLLAGEAEVAEAGSRVTADEEAIRSVGFQARSEAFEQFRQLPDQVRERLERETISAIADVALLALEVAVGAVAPLNPWKAQSLLGRLKRIGFDSPMVSSLVRAVGRAKGKPARARAIQDLVRFLAREKDVAEHSQPENADQIAEGVSAVLGWAIKDPAISARIAVYKWVASRVYDTSQGVVAVGEVEALVRLTESDLARLRDLDDRLTRDIDVLSRERDALLNLPVCR
jgi:hypothetical protein